MDHLDNFISPEYRALQEKYHSECKDWGTSGQHCIDEVKFFIEHNDVKSVLDYGCGKNTLVKGLETKLPNITFSSYDPCIKEYSSEPQPADFVICTDVLEHIEPDKIDAVLDHLASLTKKVGYFVISLQKAKHNLPDGRNAHLIIQPRIWWEQKLTSRFKTVRTLQSHSHELLCEVRND